MNEEARSRALLSLLLLVSLVLFLWMFFASEGLERLADAGLILGAADAPERARAFASDWRHGMSGSSMLYTPGFFAAAIAMWRLARISRVGRLVREGAAVLALAVLIAVGLTPIGTLLVLGDFEASTGLICGSLLHGPTPRGLVFGTLTLASWMVFVACAQRAVAKISLVPLLPALGSNIVLVCVRPFTADDLFVKWGHRIAEGDPIATLSVLMVLPITTLIVWPDRSREEFAQRRQDAKVAKSFPNLKDLTLP